jgi:FimV-like protein
METNDIEAAREILQEIILEADESGKSKAQAMLDNLNN